MRSAKPARPSTSACPNAPRRPYAKQIPVRAPTNPFPNSFLSASRNHHRTQTNPHLPHAVAKIDAIQAEYSAFETLHETDDLISTARELNIAYVAYSPLGHGWLVDDFPYQSPEDFAEDDFRRTVPKFQGQNFYDNKKIVEQIKAIAKSKQCTLTQVALAWVIAQGMIPIPGTTKPGRLEENFASRRVELTEGEKKEMRRILDSVKPQGNRYSERAQAMVGH
jgi:aryl-alcohol dehydrogenase-like predicted oxidoreductase